MEARPEHMLLYWHAFVQLIAGWVLAFLFQVGHVVEEAAFPVVEKSNGISTVSEGWAALQVIKVEVSLVSRIQGLLK